MTARNELKPGVNWVGVVDWAVRDFHGYRTDSGSSYNAYLIQDEKTAVIDSVKAPFANEYLRKVAELTPLDQIDYVICNHAEPDHSGSIPMLMKAAPQAVVVCDAKCQKILSQHYDTSAWTFQIVKTGDELALGKRHLQFIETPMVHWPESMFSYCPEEKILFSMDAFGQHYASSGRFDDTEPLSLIKAEAKTYYANIVMLYARPIAKALEAGAALDIEIIAPSHGIIWRTHVDVILGLYKKWVTHYMAPKVLIVYETMWQSTKLMADAIAEGAMENGNVDVRLHSVSSTNRTILATEVLDAAAVAVGTPTLNMTLMPQLAAALTYWKGLKPAGKAGMVFGSYGWSKGGPRDAEAYLTAMKWDIVREMLEVQYVPTPEDLSACREAGRLLAAEAEKRAAPFAEA